MNKKFVREVLRLLPDFSVVSGGYFYEMPFCHVLSGFCWERPRGLLYIWKYACPLYEDFGNLHLGFGDRLPEPDDSMPLLRGEEVAMAQEFVRRIAPYREAISRLRDLQHFLDYLESAPERLKNPVLRFAYAQTLVMAGRDADAMEQLKICIDCPQDYTCKADVRKFVEYVKDGSARSRLLLNEEMLKSKLGIHGSVH